MPRVTHVKKARRDYPDSGIQKGDEYYWWQFRFGPIVRSKTPPTRSQLTKSSYLQTIYGIEDEFNKGTWAEADDVEARVEEIKSSLDDLKSELEGNLENMPEQLRESSSAGELLQERIDNLDSAISELESIDVNPPDADELKDYYDGEIQGWIDEKRDEVEQALSNLS